MHQSMWKSFGDALEMRQKSMEFDTQGCTLTHTKSRVSTIWASSGGRVEPKFALEYSWIVSQLATGCVTCHTCHSCVTDFRPILGNPVEVTHVTSPGHVYISHTKGLAGYFTSFFFTDHHFF